MHWSNDLFSQLSHWVKQQPDAPLYTFLNAVGEPCEQVSYQQFMQQVDQLAAHFYHTIKAPQGHCVLLCYQPGLAMIYALFACNKAGFIGIPTPPLTTPTLKAWRYRLSHLLRDSSAEYMALDQQTEQLIQIHIISSATTEQQHGVQQLRAVQFINTERIDDSATAILPTRKPQAIFFIQYTSGSTSEPKGIAVTHQNLLDNCKAVVDHRKPIAVSWLPQHHDMGLIGYYINIALVGGRTIGFSPSTFIKRPMLWFETMTRFKATASSAPNFALELCLHERRIPTSALAEIDLSTLRFMMVAAEPVDCQHFARFFTKFAACGLTQHCFFAAYGLAEFTLAVSNYGRSCLSVEADALSQGRVKSVATREKAYAIALMSCGVALGDTQIKIVNPTTQQPVGHAETGEVWLSGNSKAHAYWQQDALTKQVFHTQLNDTVSTSKATYLRTGDIGFLHQGELYICGRLNDMMSLHGRNIYPQDIEKIIQNSSPKIRSNGVVAFNLGKNKIAVVAEVVRIKDLPDATMLIQAVREALQAPLTHLAFLAPRSVAKTSSGKVCRRETKKRFQNGQLNVLSEQGEQRLNNETDALQEGIDELDVIKQRYQLTGKETFTLFDAGIDSLDLVILLAWIKDSLAKNDASQLAERINTRLFGILTIQQLFSLGRIIQHQPELINQDIKTLLNQVLAEQVVKEQQQMRLDRLYDIPTATIAKKEVISTKIKTILLTGSTGFLGAFLLLSLVEQTRHTLFVLVRASDQTHAEQRLRETLQTTLGKSAPLTEIGRRLHVVCGDLEQPQWGLSLFEWQALSHKIDCIYHNGALVNYLLDYQHMRQANVEGTRQILDFALTGRNKVVNYISTTFIFGWATKDVLYEQDQNEGMDDLDFGYSQSKWVAEQLVFSAMEQGLAARVFRPALITPALDGRGGNMDITLRLLRFMIDHRICVDTQNQVSFMPAEVTATNIVAVAEQQNTVGKTFHITRDQLETLPQITDILSEQLGLNFDAFPLREFVPEVIKRCTPNDALYPLLDFLVGSIENISAMEYKLYSNENYRTSRNASLSGRSDLPLADVVEGIIAYLGDKKVSA